MTKTKSKKVAAGEALPTVSQETIPGFASSYADIPLQCLVRHPDNRHPTRDSVSALAASMTDCGQLEPIVVRAIPDSSAETYQILSGETRYLASVQIRQRTIKAQILVGVSDRQALQIVAIANAKRTDLNPIQRAELLKRLTDSVDTGGAGLTQEVAGDEVGLSRSAVANAVRILKAPKGIRELVASGKLPETFVRPFLPMFEGKGTTLAADSIRTVLGRIAKDEQAIADWSREEFVRQVTQEIFENSRSLEPADKYDRTSSWSLQKATKPSGSLFYSVNCYFDPTESEPELSVFECPTARNAKGTRRCLNVKLFDRLNAEAAKEILANLEKKSKKAAAAGKKEKPKALTPAEAAKAEKERKAKRAEAVVRWYHKLKRWYLARIIRTNPQLAEPIVAGIMIHLATSHMFGVNGCRDRVGKRMGIKPTSFGSSVWSANAVTSANTVAIHCELAREAMWSGAEIEFNSNDQWDAKLIDAFFSNGHLYPDTAWSELFGLSCEDRVERAVFLEKLVRAYGSAAGLAEECGVKCPPNTKSAAIVDAMLSAADKGLLFFPSILDRKKGKAKK